MGKNRALLSVLVSIVLFVGGIVLLILRLPFWSLFLGLPATQIGLILLIFSFDRLSQEEIEEELRNFKDGFKKVKP